MKSAKNESALIELIRLLSSGNMMTAAQIAQQTGCSKPVAYDRLCMLKRRGVEFQTVTVREGVTGPKSIAYAIVKREIA